MNTRYSTSKPILPSYEGRNNESKRLKILTEYLTLRLRQRLDQRLDQSLSLLPPQVSPPIFYICCCLSAYSV